MLKKADFLPHRWFAYPRRLSELFPIGESYEHFFTHPNYAFSRNPKRIPSQDPLSDAGGANQSQ